MGAVNRPTKWSESGTGLLGNLFSSFRLDRRSYTNDIVYSSQVQFFSDKMHKLTYEMHKRGKNNCLLIMCLYHSILIFMYSILS